MKLFQQLQKSVQEQQRQMLSFVERATHDVTQLQQQEKPNADQIRDSVVSQVQSTLQEGLQAVRDSMQKEVSVLRESATVTSAAAPVKTEEAQVIYAKPNRESSRPRESSHEPNRKRDDSMPKAHQVLKKAKESIPRLSQVWHRVSELVKKREFE